MSRSSPPGDTDITVYVWDHRNRLIDITEFDTPGTPATQIVTHTYDAANH